VTSLEEHELTPIDLRTATAGTPVEVLAGAVRVAAGYGSLWVTGTTNLLTRVTPPAGTAGTQQKTVQVGQGPIGVATGNGAIWVANAQDGTVSEVSQAGLFVTQTFRVGGDPLTPPPGSKAHGVGTDPRVLLAVPTGVWVGGSNPGRVLAVAPGGGAS
jgi:DNA-binding beta-propeller fold protein YncE